MLSDELLLLAAGAILFTVAAIHLVVGLISVYEWSIIGSGSLVLAALFITYGIIGYGLVGLHITALIAPRMGYLLASLFLAVGLISYLEFHIFQLTSSVLPLEMMGLDHHHHHDHDHHHGEHTEPGVIENLILHLMNDGFALVSRSFEVIGIVILVLLYQRAPEGAAE